jgi:hypothetical protein
MISSVKGLDFAEESRNMWFDRIDRLELKGQTKMGRPWPDKAEL